MQRIGSQASALALKSSSEAGKRQFFNLFSLFKSENSTIPGALFPTGMTLDSEVKTGQPKEQMVFRGISRCAPEVNLRWRQHPAVAMVAGMEQARLVMTDTKNVTIEQIHDHRIGGNHFVSTTSDQDWTRDFGDFSTQYNTATIPLIDISATGLERVRKEFGEDAVQLTLELKQYGALFLLQHTMVQFFVGNGVQLSSKTGKLDFRKPDIIENPFYVSLDLTNSNDRELLESASRINDLFFQCMQNADCQHDETGAQNEKFEKLLVEYINETIAFYDKKFGVRQNPLRKSLAELKMLSAEAEKYVQYIEQSPGLSSKSCIDLLSNGSTKIEPKICAAIFRAFRGRGTDKV